MKQSVIYALDFDGVVCDSAIETGVSGWKAGTQIWSDFTNPLPSEELLIDFRQVRPIMGTGYEAILIVKMLKDGDSVENIMDAYQEKKDKMLNEYGLQIDELKRLFGKTRDQWINEDLGDWIGMNPLFPAVAEKLRGLTKQGDWYIVTTKQERFVDQILKANKVELAKERIFGLDRKMTKEAILIDLQKKHSQSHIRFVEDMLPMLLKVLNNEQLKSVELFLASWGYNTAQDKLDIDKLAIELIDLDTFLV